MNKNYRLAAFYLVALITCGAIFGCLIVGFAAIPNNTIRQNAGAVMPTFNATGAGYFVGPNMVISATRAATFVTVDTGQGANDLYPMDQAARTTDDVQFHSIDVQELNLNSVNKTDYFTASLVESVTYIVSETGGTYSAKNGETGQETIWADFSTLMRTLDVEGNNIFIKNGAYQANSDIPLTQDFVKVEAESKATVITVKDQPQTTLTAGVNIGNTVLPVANNAGFSVGEKIQINNGALMEHKYIQSLGVNTIVVTPLTKAHNNGVPVISVLTLFYITGDDVTIKNIKIDGNSANWPTISLECGAAYEIDAYNGNRLLIENVEITNSRHRPFRASGDDITLRNCYFHDMSAAGGVHFEGVSSLWTRAHIQDCVFIMPSGIGSVTPTLILNNGTDLSLKDTYIFGHALFTVVTEGLIENCVFEPNDWVYRTNVYGCHDLNFEHNKFYGERLYLYQYSGPPVIRSLRNKITNNLFEGNGAQLTVTTNSYGTKIEENTFREIAANTALDIAASSGTRISDVDITNNMFYNITATYTVKVDYADGISFSGNKQYNCRLNQFTYCNGLSITDNIIRNMASHVFSISTSNQNVLIQNNQLISCSARGVSLTAGGGFPTTPIKIKDNILGAATPYLNDGSYQNVRINDNIGYVTENIGTTTILNGTTSIVITHGLGYTPTSGNTAWTVSYLENPTNDPGSWYIGTFTATQATIHVFRDPGVSQLDIAWSARRTP